MKLIKIFASIISILILGSVMLLFVSQSQAQETEKITITPPSVQVTLNPGDTTEGALGIINDSDADLYFSTNVYDFIVTDTNGTPQMLPRGTIANNKYSAANWIAVAPTEFTVTKHTRFDFNYYIKVPSDALPGGHYAALMYAPSMTTNNPANGATIQAQIATLVYINIRGTVKEQAQVTKFTAPPFSEYGPIQIATQIRNQGDLHITPQGKIEVKDVFGRVIAKSSLETKNIFPGDIARDYSNTLGGKIMIGPFTAQLIGSYGTSGNLPLTATVVFWVFPWKLTAISLTLLVVIILGILLWRKKKKQEDDMLSAFDPKNLS